MDQESIQGIQVPFGIEGVRIEVRCPRCRVESISLVPENATPDAVYACSECSYKEKYFNVISKGYGRYYE